jgi:hypothetical protein
MNDNSLVLEEPNLSRPLREREALSKSLAIFCRQRGGSVKQGRGDLLFLHAMMRALVTSSEGGRIYELGATT